jgi:endonuclease G
MRAKRAKKRNKKSKNAVIIICIILLLLIIIFSSQIAEEESIDSGNHYAEDMNLPEKNELETKKQPTLSKENKRKTENSEKNLQLQMNCTGQELKRKSFTICFNESKKIANYTHHVLTKAMVENSKKIKRPAKFYRDPHYTSKVNPKDYVNSDYDKGHLVPAGDLGFDSLSLYESMYMTNIAPQNKYKNRAQWNQLESHGRSLALNYDSIEVITGVIFVADSLYETIGLNEVAVPHYWYKIFKYKDEYECYIMRNEKLEYKYSYYKVEKKECETKTGVK